MPVHANCTSFLLVTIDLKSKQYRTEELVVAVFVFFLIVSFTFIDIVVFITVVLGAITVVVDNIVVNVVIVSRYPYFTFIVVVIVMSSLLMSLPLSRYRREDLSSDV